MQHNQMFSERLSRNRTDFPSIDWNNWAINRGFYGKYLGRDAKHLQINDPQLQQNVETGKAVTFLLLIELNIRSDHSFLRHITFTLRESDSRGTKTTSESRKNIINIMSSLNPLEFKPTIVGFTALGPKGKKFIAAICHFGTKQTQFQDIYHIGDPEAQTYDKICHVSTCLGYNENSGKIDIRGNDPITLEHLFWIKAIETVSNFYPNGGDLGLPEVFSQGEYVVF